MPPEFASSVFFPLLSDLVPEYAFFDFFLSGPKLKLESGKEFTSNMTVRFSSPKMYMLVFASEINLAVAF